MPFILKSQEPSSLLLSSGGQEFTIVLQNIPATTLFELAQIFQEARRKAPRDERNQVMIPAAFARIVVDAVVEASCSWEGVLDESGKTKPFSRESLRAIIESDVSLIPQLIAHVADLFARTQREQADLEEEEKN